MNEQQIKGNWKQLKGSALEKWGELTEDDVDQVAGRREALVGKLQERYGMASEAIDKEVDDWLNSLKESARPGAQERAPRP